MMVRKLVSLFILFFVFKTVNKQDLAGTVPSKPSFEKSPGSVLGQHQSGKKKLFKH